MFAMIIFDFSKRFIAILTDFAGVGFLGAILLQAFQVLVSLSPLSHPAVIFSEFLCKDRREEAENNYLVKIN